MTDWIPPRICYDCKHLWRPMMPGMYAWPRCTRPLLDKPRSLITGKHPELSVDPASERRNGRTLFGRERCGPDAQFFEAAPPMRPPSPRPMR